MSSTKRRRVPALGETTPPQPFIPVDLLLEIIVRADSMTIIHCAATSKPIRRAILDPDFNRRLADVRGPRSTFDPALFVGLSYVFYDSKRHPRRHTISQCQPRARLSYDANLLWCFEPMTCRGPLIILHRRRAISAELRIINTLTGQVTRVRSASPVSAMYPRTFLSVGDGGSSFRLLVADRKLTMRVYSSEHGKWGDIVEPDLPPNFFTTCPNRCSPSVVFGDNTVHWLCREKGIVAVDVNAARASVIELPPKCFSQEKRVKGVDRGLLAATGDGRLSLLVAEISVISMWTLSEKKKWSRHVVIHRQAIGTGDVLGSAVRFLRFGERSGTVMLQMEQVGLVQINLVSREAHVLNDDLKLQDIDTDRSTQLQLCLHETDLPTLMKNRKRF